MSQSDNDRLERKFHKDGLGKPRVFGARLPRKGDLSPEEIAKTYGVEWARQFELMGVPRHVAEEMAETRKDNPRLFSYAKRIVQPHELCDLTSKRWRDVVAEANKQMQQPNVRYPQEDDDEEQESS